MAFNLPDLPYPSNALEPVIDQRTMEIHHDKHHGGFVSKLNDAVKGTEWESKSVDEICRSIGSVPEAKRTAVRNNGGGHYNHSLFWTILAPPSSGGGGEPSGELADAIGEAFGSFNDFKEQFTTAATGRFGSGWAWLVVRNGSLEVGSTANQDNPLMGESLPGIMTGIPIVGLDVWEHAYYLNYQNRRPDYVKAWWDVVNWSAVAKRFDQARSAVATV